MTRNDKIFAITNRETKYIFELRLWEISPQYDPAFTGRNLDVVDDGLLYKVHDY